MLRLSRVAQFRGLPLKPRVALNPLFARYYAVPPKSHFQKGDTPPEQHNSSAGPKSFFQGGDMPPPPSGAAGRILVAEPRSRFRMVSVVLLLVLFTGVTGFLLFPSHSFPPEVAALLRKALKAESESFGGQNLQEAIKYYIEALMEAEALGVEPWSDEYTGIQLKLAEMYEMLNYPDAANEVYMEICGAYFTAFMDKDTPIPSSLRPMVAQRGLRIALKMCHVGGKDNTQQLFGTLALMTALAQEEVKRRCPEASDLIEMAGGAMPPSEREYTAKLVKVAATSRKLRENGEFEAWMPFRDELIAARDVITTYKLTLDLPERAIREKQITYQIMLASGCGTSELLLAQANLASMYYFVSEKLEMMVNNATENNQTVITIPGQNEMSVEMLKASIPKALHRAETGYSRVLLAIPSLTPDVRRTKEVEEAQALCTYGAGVIAIKKGKLETAKDKLLEARTRAKGCSFDDLVVAADAELAKVDELAKEAEKPVKEAEKPKEVTEKKPVEEIKEKEEDK